MSLIDPQIPKEYQNGRVLFEQNLDAWRESVEDYFATINLNLTQLRKDAFLANYDFDNDGNANLPKNLQQQINDLTSGATPIGGTTSDTWTINSDGNSSILSTAGLTAVRTYTFPDASGVLVVATATQTLSNKTFSDNIVWSSGVASTGTLDHANTAARIYTFPDASGTVVLNSTAGSGGLVPVGSIIPFYDFNALATFDSSSWRYCDGSVLVLGGSILNGQTLPDLSGRYLVGFGTDGGGDIDTAAWATATVGNAGNTINIAHTHTVAAHTHDLSNHTHDLSNHTHNGAAHTHDLSSAGWARVAAVGGGSGDILMEVTAADNWTSNRRCDSSDQVAGEAISEGAILDGATDSSGSGATGVPSSNTSGVPSTNTSGSASPATDSQLSAVQSIQPISIRVRYIMRVA